MTDEEMTKLCAEALGWKHLGAVGVEPPPRDKQDYSGLWCRSGGNDWWINPLGHNVCGPCSGIPDPLNNDADAMALVKKVPMVIEHPVLTDRYWHVESVEIINGICPVCISPELNRAIAECVARIQVLRQPQPQPK